MYRPAENLEKPLPSTSDKPLPAITESVTDDLTQLNLHDPGSIDQELRTALTDPRIFETVPAVLSPSCLISDSGVLSFLRTGQTTRRPRIPLPRRTPRRHPRRHTILISRVKDNTISSSSAHNTSSQPAQQPSQSQNYGRYGFSAQNHYEHFLLPVSLHWNSIESRFLRKHAYHGTFK